MVRGEGGSDHIRNWMRNRNTVGFFQPTIPARKNQNNLIFLSHRKDKKIYYF